MAIDFSLEIEIACPRPEVFAMVTDPARLQDWQPLVVEVERVDEGQLRVGSRIREVRQVRGRRLEQMVEVAELDPPTRFGLRTVEGPLPLDGDLTFSPTAAGGTLLHVHAHGHASGIMRLLEPLLALGLKRQFRAQYRRLKELLEGAGAGLRG